MAVKSKSPRKKRDLVIPFAGEEKFVVPKRRGFGQPDMQEYVMVTGAGSTLLDPSTSPSPTPSTTTTTAGTTTTGSTSPTGSPTTTSGGLLTSTTTGYTSGEPSTGGLGTLTGTITQPSTTGTTSGGIATGTITTSTGGTRTVTGTTLDTPISMPSNWSTVSCSDLSTWIQQLETLSNDTRLTQSLRTTYATNLSAARSAYQTNCPTRQAPIVSLPSFPVWSSLNCPDFDGWISYLEGYAANYTWSTADAATLNSQIAQAKAMKTTKCAVTPVVPVIPIGGGGAIGGGGGMGGGGGAEEPETTDQQAPTEEKKSGISWLVIIAVLGGIYLLARK